MKIIMHKTEIDLFSAFLSQALSYFEFGMGGSTCLAAQLVRDRIHAIDSDPAWVEKVREEIGGVKKEIQISAVNIGLTGNWGHPIGRDHEALFENYSCSITRTGFLDYDFCLVDGRFRVACFLQALSVLRTDAVIGFHDYSSRPNYHLIEEFARPVAGANELRLFVRRADVDCAARRCCRTLAVEDSQCESMRLDGSHEQTDTRPLPHDELVQLHCFAAQARVAADLVGQGDDLARAA